MFQSKNYAEIIVRERRVSTAEADGSVKTRGGLVKIFFGKIDKRQIKLCFAIALARNFQNPKKSRLCRRVIFESF